MYRNNFDFDCKSLHQVAYHLKTSFTSGQSQKLRTLAKYEWMARDDPC